jgi:predicted RNA binding protein YcfA (HicA-like mRNA interferase family)
MSKLPVISGKNCIKVLEKFGFVVYRQRGSHVTLVRENPPGQTTVPLHRELDRGTLRAILRQTGIGVDEFVEKL